jgi:hypothetical protein
MPDSRLYAVIDPASPRYAGWVRELGRDYVPVKSAESTMCEFLDSPASAPAPCYLVDLDRLHPEVAGPIYERSAEQYGVPVGVVRAEFRELGMPILAGPDVVVCEDPRDGRLRFSTRKGGGK